MAVELTPNAISDIIAGDQSSKTVQVVEMTLSSSKVSPRYVMSLSDSVEAKQAMISVLWHERVKTYGIKEGSIVKLNIYAYVTATANRSIIVVFDMEPVIIDCEIIGNPKPVQGPFFPRQKAVTSECEIIGNPKQTTESSEIIANPKPLHDSLFQCQEAVTPKCEIIGNPKQATESSEIIGNPKPVHESLFQCQEAVTSKCEIIGNPKQTTEFSLQPQKGVPTGCDDGHQPLAPGTGQMSGIFHLKMAIYHLQQCRYKPY